MLRQRGASHRSSDEAAILAQPAIHMAASAADAEAQEAELLREAGYSGSSSVDVSPVASPARNASAMDATGESGGADSSWNPERAERGSGWQEVKTKRRGSRKQLDMSAAAGKGERASSGAAERMSE